MRAFGTTLGDSRPSHSIAHDTVLQEPAAASRISCTIALDSRLARCEELDSFKTHRVILARSLRRRILTVNDAMHLCDYFNNTQLTNATIADIAKLAVCVVQHIGSGTRLAQRQGSTIPTIEI